MYKRLQELGIPSTIVRNTDETLERKERINRIMNDYGNSPDVIMISNHINAGGLGCPCLGSRFKLGY